MGLGEFPNPCIFAHRGACAYAPENTLASFKLAIQQNAPAIELDVKLTRDGEVVVIHDPTLDRTTGYHGKVCDQTLEELRNLEAGSFFAEQFRGEPIPTLKEVFDLVDHKVLINIELTNYTTPRDNLVDRVADLMTAAGYLDGILFSSFNLRNLKRAKERLPQIPCGLLALPGLSGWWARSISAGWPALEAIHPYHSDVNLAYVQSEHQKGRRVHIWTVNSEAEMHRLRELKVDGIFSDDPILAINSMGSFQDPNDE